MTGNGAIDLTHEETARQMATLTPKGYRGLVSYSVRTDWFRLTTDLAYLGTAKNPAEVLVEEATVRSGSVGGEHRRDVRDAIQQAPQSVNGFSLMSGAGQPSEPAQEAAKAAGGQRKRGWW